MIKLYDTICLDAEKNISILSINDQESEPIKFEGFGSVTPESPRDQKNGLGFRRVSGIVKPSSRHASSDRRQKLEKKTCSGNFQKDLFKLGRKSRSPR